MAPIRLIYSSVRRDVSAAILDAVLEISCRNNSRDDITGVLIASDKHFVQLLEGDRASVGRCLMRIMQDPRHEDVQIICANAVPHRLFPDWSMYRVEIPSIRRKLLERYLIQGAFRPTCMSQVELEDLCRVLASEPGRAVKASP